MPKYSTGQAQSVELRDFAPDLKPDTPGILLDMDGFVPTMKGYASRNSPMQFAPSLPSSAIPTGSYIALFSNGALAIYAGTGDSLFRLDSGGWTQVGSGYGTTTRWHFAQFGDDVIAVAGNVAPQVAAGPSSNFSDLSGAPNGATTVVSIASLVFMASGATWYNSAIGFDNNWTPDIQTQAATGVLTDYPGPVTALAPLFRNVVIFKNNSMLSGQLIGGESIWSFQLLSDETGAQCQEAVVVLPEAVAFLGNDDFYVTTGYAPQRIQNSLKEWFFANADPTQFTNMWSWYDQSSSIIYWHFVSNTPAIEGVCDLWVAYNVRVGRWAKGHLNTYCVCLNTQPGLNSGLFWDTLVTMNTWIGDPGQAYLKTGYIGQPGVLSQIMRVRPLYNTYPDGTPEPDLLTPFHTNIIGVGPTQDAAAVRGSDGWHYYRAYDRYHQIQLNTNGPAEIAALSAEIREGGVQ